MKNIYYILCFILMLSCGNNSKTKSSEKGLPTEERTVIKEKLDSKLVQGIFDLVKSKEHLKYPEIPLDESFFAIGFLKGSSIKIESDSIVSIFYYYNSFDSHDKENNYKGMIRIEGYNVAIFDRGHFGDKFYNADSLKQIRLDSFKSYPLKNIPIARFHIHDGRLNYHGLGVIPTSLNE